MIKFFYVTDMGERAQACVFIVDLLTKSVLINYYSNAM